MNKPLWLVGAGYMAREYIKVLDSLGAEFLAVCRSEESAQACARETGCEPVSGGLARLLERKGPPSMAIVAAGVQDLAGTALELLDAGVKHILMEKPGGLDSREIARVAERTEKVGAGVFLAYNRRFFASVRMARTMIAEDGGPRSFFFEFTEWPHVVEASPQPPEVKHRWFLANSSHVADLAFFLGGDPEAMHCHISGALPWHPSASVFTGSGVSRLGARFSYMADWDAPGRWGVEVLTTNRRLILRPMETLIVQAKGTVRLEQAALNDDLDVRFKPGLFLQTKAFIENDTKELRSIESQAELALAYDRMAGYTI